MNEEAPLQSTNRLDQRVSDHDPDQVADALRSAAGEGRLSLTSSTNGWRPVSPPARTRTWPRLLPIYRDSRRAEYGSGRRAHHVALPRTRTGRRMDRAARPHTGQGRARRPSLRSRACSRDAAVADGSRDGCPGRPAPTSRDNEGMGHGSGGIVSFRLWPPVAIGAPLFAGWLATLLWGDPVD